MTTTQERTGGRGSGQFSSEVDGGRWKRQRNAFTDRFSADGSTGFPAVAGRYHLYACQACPWAHRSVIVRELLGLTDVIGLTYVDPIRDERGWRFTLEPDPVEGFALLSEAYDRTDPDYSGRVTVPCIWDRETGRLVTNDYPQITLDLETEFAHLHADGAPDLYPEHLRAEIDELVEPIYQDVNNGVYRAGFATTQDAYEEAYEALFSRLDALEGRLSTRRYLMGDDVTEADVRLFTTLVRFDAVYHGHFKCNRQKIAEFEHLSGYARDLFSIPAFGGTTDFDAIKRHYYVTHDTINPTGVVPAGPDESWWQQPHGRG